MPNAWDGVARHVARFRPAKPERSATLTRLHRGAVRLARRVVDLATGHPTLPVQRSVSLARGELRRPALTGRRSVVRRRVAVQLRSERTVPLAVALVVLLAGVVSLGPGVVRPVGAAERDSGPVRLAIGGGGQFEPTNLDYAAVGSTETPGTYAEDGTLYKPVAVDTTIESSSDLLRQYTVRPGDSLTGIAARFGVSMMTIWWANHLTSKDELHTGQVLVIPPTNGLVVTVQVGDTLDSLAARYKVSADTIVSENGLTDTNLIVGQVLIMPGAKGAPIPTPTPKPRVTTRTTRIYPVSGSWAWPVIGGGNYISQYFSSYHPAIDIAAKYGTPVVAPRAGRVVFAGWKGTGGGYQVWIDIGGGLYTNEEHFSAILVSAGQWVSKGQQIGRIGTSGYTTGPHVHFEVWVGKVWQPGSYRLNPLRYY